MFLYRDSTTGWGTMNLGKHERWRGKLIVRRVFEIHTYGLVVRSGCTDQVLQLPRIINIHIIIHIPTNN